LYGVLGYNYFPVAVSNFMASVLSVIYTVVFYRYTTDRAYAHKVIAFFLAFDAAATGYAYLAVSYFGQPRAEVQSLMGVIGILTVFMFFASPSENIALVFRHRTGAYIPIELVTVGAINSFFWSFYALLQADWILFAPNFGALLLGVAQVALYFAFHPSKAQPEVVDPASVEMPLTKQSAGYGTVHA
jgi:solute carrier family 50 (sugar transporter)